MAAQTRLTQQVDGLTVLHELIDLAKNPDKIIAAHKIAQAELALTDEMQKKADEAKAFIARHTEFQKALQDGHSALDAAKALFDKEKEDFRAESAERMAQLDAQDAQSKTIMQAQAETDALQRKERAKIDADRKAFDASIAETKKQLDADRAFVAQKNQDNIDDAVKLGNQRDELNKRLNNVKLREQAADSI